MLVKARYDSESPFVLSGNVSDVVCPGDSKPRMALVSSLEVTSAEALASASSRFNLAAKC